MPGYFQAMGIAMKAGRDFDEHDGANDGTLGAIGKRIASRSSNPKWVTVVGVAHDVRHYGLDREVRPGLYMPHLP